MERSDGSYRAHASNGPTRSAGAFCGTAAILLVVLAPRVALAANNDLCNTASAATVGRALHATIVRAEAPASDAGCEYSSKGTPADSASNHATSMIGEIGGVPMDPNAAKAISAFSHTMLGGASAKQDKEARHPGETVALVFTVTSGNAQQEMETNRDMLGRLGPIIPVPGLGDEAFSTSGSVMLVRKGDKFVRFIYTACNCASNDVAPLAKQIVAAL